MKEILTPLLQIKHLFLLCALLLLGFMILIPFFTYLYFASDLKSKESIMNRNNTGIILTDREDKPFFTFYEAHTNKTVPLSQVSSLTQKALIASEDKDFYAHSGFSLSAITRSFYLDIVNRKAAYGGSTLTQQLVKNVLLNSSKNLLRKYQEVVLAMEIERRYSKDEILEMYLNSVYFGQGAFGISDAAHTYFGKTVDKLSLGESALMIAILPAPSALSPAESISKSARDRQLIVLKKMYEQGYITAKQEKAAENEQIQIHLEQKDINVKAPHFALFVKDELVKKYGEERISRSGFRVKTTLDMSLQTYAEQVLSKQLEYLKWNKATNGAVVVMDPKNGEILSLVGSQDWNDSENGKINMALSPRSPGSSFKPIIYTAALDYHLITPATILPDSPTTFPDNYKPLDYDRAFRGEVTVRRALSNSLNIPSVAVMQKVGIQNGIDYARKLGITTLKDVTSYGLSLVLGTGEIPLLEMTNAYATFANHGAYNPPTAILSIVDKSNNEIYNYKPKPQQVISEDAAFLISSILADNKSRSESFGSSLTINRPAAVKTGTAEDYRDALTLGYTPSKVVGVWIGNNDNSPMDHVAGSLGAAPIWRQIIEQASRESAIEKFEAPQGIKIYPICAGNGLLLRSVDATTSAVVEYFIQGTQPKRYCLNENALSITPTPSPTQAADTLTPTSTPTLTPTQPVNPTILPTIIDTQTPLSPTP